MNKVLVKVYVPMLEEQYDIWLPLNKRIYNIIVLLTKAINELKDGYYLPESMPNLYEKLTGNVYDINTKVIDSNIKNGTELILL